MENLRVCRAGYCYRRPFHFFLDRYELVIIYCLAVFVTTTLTLLGRYKSLCPQTWPSWKGDPGQGTKILTDYLKLPQGEVAIGETKVFIRNPKTVQSIETAYQKKKPALATKIQVWL